jgi:hypothetical protein
MDIKHSTHMVKLNFMNIKHSTDMVKLGKCLNILSILK